MATNENRASTPRGIAEHVAGRLVGVKWHDGYLEAFCPAHDNTKTRALSVKLHADGVGVKCHGFPQCSTAAILDAVGMHPAELFVSARLVSRNGKPKAQTRETRDAVTYTYLDADGRLYLRVHRKPGKAGFWQQRHDAESGGWENGLNGTEPILYRADLLAREWDKAAPLFIVEGEKDCDRLIAEGRQATTAPMGAGKWRPEYADQLSGYEDVRVIPDNDSPGRAHAEAVLATLPNAGLVELDGLPERGDVSDWLDAGHTGEELVRIEPVEPASPEAAQTAGPRSYNLTDYGLAERLVHHHGDDLRHVFAWHRDLVYDGRRFALDETAEAVRRTKRTVRAIYAEAADEPDDGRRKALADFARRAEAKAKIDAALGLARSEPGVAITHDQLDADPYRLNVRNGTIDLTTGELREHDRADLITKLAPVEHDPAAEAPTFHEFLARILPSEELRRFVQRVAGYTLTGDVSEQALFFLYGTGANGKSTLINALMLALGDYAKQAAPDLLVVKRGSHPTELADLFGARLVASTEVEDGRKLAESLVKQITGGEPIRARRMREDFWEFPPTHKVLLSANHKPTVRGVDHAIWRRIKVIPFEVTVPDAEQDKRLPAKLRAELPGILRWALDGCLDWQRHGLGEPTEVREATETYRAEQDVVGAFIEERCVTGPRLQGKMKELYGSYVAWCDESGEDPVNKRTFGDTLKERGHEPDKGTGNAAIRRGIGLRSDHPGEPDAWEKL